MADSACTVCVHPCRADIDRLLASGGSIRKVASAYALGRGAVQRHRLHTLNPQVRQEREAAATLTLARRETWGSTITEKLAKIEAVVGGLIEKHASNPGVVLSACRELRGVLADARDLARVEELAAVLEELTERVDAATVGRLGR